MRQKCNQGESRKKVGDKSAMKKTTAKEKRPKCEEEEKREGATLNFKL